MTTTTGQPGDSVQRLLPWLVAVAFFMQSLDTTILNTAVPAIARSMEVTPLNVKSVLASYTLSLAVFIPVSGWMADRFGTRRVFAAAIGLFTLGSVLCGLATSLEMLVAFRVVQGMGGAMMMPVGRMTLARTFGKAELVRVMSFVAIPSLVGPMVGPVAGGLIVTYLDWRGVFYVNVPVGLLGLYFVQRYLPDYREPKVHRLDIAGLVLFGGGIALLSYVLEVFGDHSLSRAEMMRGRGRSMNLSPASLLSSKRAVACWCWMAWKQFWLTHPRQSVNAQKRIVLVVKPMTRSSVCFFNAATAVVCC